MDRQAFKQRMQQLKQYREQNPGKTYLDFKKYAEGGEIPPSNKPIIPEEPQPYKGKLYKDRYGRKYTEDQMNEYYDSSTDEIDRFTGKPFVRGLKPVGDIEDAANATPVGDAISAYDTYKALKNKDWGNAGLAALGLVPFVPSFGGATGMNNEFLRKLGDKSKFIPFNQAKTMYPNMTRDMYDNILQGTEIKSYMNQFRNYLDQKGKLNRGNYTGSYKNLKKEIIDAPKESFNNIKAIFNLYRSPKLFNKDFQMIPIVNNTNDNTIA